VLFSPTDPLQDRFVRLIAVLDLSLHFLNIRLKSASLFVRSRLLTQQGATDALDDISPFALPPPVLRLLPLPALLLALQPTSLEGACCGLNSVQEMIEKVFYALSLSVCPLLPHSQVVCVGD
jgi:hypothetical protein